VRYEDIMSMKPATNLIFRIACAVILANSALPAVAETTDPKSEIVGLDQLMAEMLHNNPELQAARKGLEAMQKRPGQASALPDPEVRLGWASVGAPLPGFGLGSEPTANLGIEISQTFPFPGKQGLRGSVANRNAVAESFMFQGTELNLISRLKSSFYELQFLYDAIDVLNRNKSLLQRLAKVAENRYSAGETAQQDLIKSQVEISMLETRLLDFERRKQSAIAEINALVSREIGATLGRPEPSGTLPALPPLDAMKESAEKSSPILRAQRASIDGRQFSLELARRDYYPDFEVMGGYFNQGSMKDMWEFRVKVNIPIFFARKQRLGVEEAGARLSEAQKTYRAREQMIGFRMKDQYLAAENALRLMDLYSKRIIPQASLALESSVTSYGTGKIDFLSVLSNVSTILENEVSYYESRMRYLQAYANVRELMGQE
jgi:outer membrane protein, heavy metal efflux system